jgi:hypothetical protein
MKPLSTAMRTSLQSILALVSLIPSLALVITPAMPRDVFCISTHVVVGTVLKATPNDCRIDAKREGRVISDCIPQDLVSLVVEISEVLGQKDEAVDYPREAGIGIGETVELSGSLLRSIAFPAAGDYGSIAVVSPSSEPITNEAIAETFEGQQFIFALYVHQGNFGKNGQRDRAAMEGHAQN